MPEYGIPRLPSKDADGRPLAGRGWYGESRLPDWVKNQRESWHGVDYQYHGALPYEEDFRNYCETVTSIGKLWAVGFEECNREEWRRNRGAAFFCFKERGCCIRFFRHN